MRQYKFDTMRFLLIYLVVFGHLVQILASGTKPPVLPELYYVIYSFHVPALIFISGYFARYNRKKILLYMCWPYFLFQVLYLLQDARIHQTEQWTVQFTTPYWLLWYLLALIMYYLILPVIDVKKTSARIAVLAGTIFLSLAAGFDNTIGYYLTLSRFFTFLPYFTAGYYLGQICREEGKGRRLKNLQKNIWLKGLSLIAVGGCIYYIVQNARAQTLNVYILYGSYSYQAAVYSPRIKFELLLVAAIWIAFLLLVIPDKKIPLLTSCGRYTLMAYLLHGFVQRYIAYEIYPIMQMGQTKYIWWSALVALMVLLVLCNSFAASVFTFVCTGKWIDVLGTWLKKRRANRSR